MTRAVTSNAVWRALLIAFVLTAGLAPRALAADPLDEDAYSQWVSDHALRLMNATQLPGEFTLSDLRDLAIELGNLTAEARAVDPPPRFAAAHEAYLTAMDAVDRTRDALQAVVLTRRPVPELRPALDESGDLVANALRAMRDSGVALPGYLLGMLAISDDANPMLGLGTGMRDTSQSGQDVPGPTAPPPTAANAAPAAAPSGAPAATGPVAPAPAVPDACAGLRSCAASTNLRIRVLTYGPVQGRVTPVASPGAAPDSGTGRASSRSAELVALRVRLDNHGKDTYILSPSMFTVANDEGRSGRLVHLTGVSELVPREGLRLEAGNSREGMVYFTLSPPQPRSLVVRDAAAPGGALTIGLP
jgi:hypothetical protein